MIGRFVWILLWESLQNVAPIAGFIYAAYKWMRDRKYIAIATIIASNILGSVAISVTEPLIYGESATLNWSWDILFNAVIFTTLSIMVMLYLVWQRRRKWDLGVSLGCGTVLTVGQALFDPVSALGIAVHSAAMSISFYIFLSFARWAVCASNDKVVLGRAFLINGIGSVVIVLIDYGYLIIGLEL
jgi:hypothetical protein